MEISIRTAHSTGHRWMIPAPPRHSAYRPPRSVHDPTISTRRTRQCNPHTAWMRNPPRRPSTPQPWTHPTPPDPRAQRNISVITTVSAQTRDGEGERAIVACNFNARGARSDARSAPTPPLPHPPPPPPHPPTPPTTHTPPPHPPHHPPTPTPSPTPPPPVLTRRALNTDSASDHGSQRRQRWRPADRSDAGRPSIRSPSPCLRSRP